MNYRNIFVLGTLVILFIKTPCQSSPWTSQAWRASSLAESVSNMLKEKNKDGEGAALISDRWNKFFRRFSKVAGLAGAIFGLLGTIIDTGPDPQHQKLLDEFSKVHEGIQTLEIQMLGLENLVKDEHARTRVYSYYISLTSAANKLSLYNENRDHYRRDLSNLWKDNTIEESLTGIYESLIGGSQFSSIIDTSYELDNGNWNSIEKLRIFWTAQLVEWHTVHVTSCMLFEQDEGKKNNTEAWNICYGIKADDFLQYEDQLYTKFDHVQAKCRNYDNMKSNLEKDLEMISSKRSSNRETVEDMVKLIKKKYFWMDANVIVYDSKIFDTNHLVVGESIIKSSNHGKKYAVMLRNKPGYRNPFERSLEYSPLLSCDPELLRRAITLDLMVRGRDVQNALSVLDGYPLLKNQIIGYAMVRSKNSVMTWYGGYNHISNDVWHMSTSTEQGLLVKGNYGYSYIISLSHEVSLYKGCPQEFPYAFYSGSHCRKRLVKDHETWFGRFYYVKDGCKPCPEGICRNYCIRSACDQELQSLIRNLEIDINRKVTAEYEWRRQAYNDLER